MLKILIPVLLGFALYFAFRARKGMSAIDNIYRKENMQNMEQLKIKAQEKLNNNKIRR